MRHEVSRLAAATAAIVAITWLYVSVLHVSNATTVALSFLLVVLVTAATGRLRDGVIASLVAMLAFNFFFLPPVGTLTIAAPENWVALLAFLGVSLIGSKLADASRGDQMKSALLASIGHDLRTPLTAIRLAATNLQTSALSEAERREQSELVLTEVERLTRLFQNILDMTRIDAGAVESTMRWVHPMEVVEAARSQVEHSLRCHPMEVSTADDVLVKLDPRLTTAALSQVLENAAQYSGEGTPIAIATSVRRGELHIRVRDRGPGIPPADIPRLFERFYRGGHAGQHTSGTGMGLSIARGLLAAEGARISAENAPGGGAIFSIVIPSEWKVVS